MTCQWSNAAELDQCMLDITNLSPSENMNVDTYTLNAFRGTELNYATEIDKF